jgi:CRP-like cAMP-binding protein
MLRHHRPDVSALAEVPPFDHYGWRSLAPLARHADRIDVAPGTTLAWEGRRAREVLVVVRGDVVVLRGGSEVERQGPGTWIGAHELLEDAAYDATVVAGNDLSVLVLSGPAFRWAAQTLPDLVPDRTPPSGASAERSGAHGQSPPLGGFSLSA